MAQDKLRRIIVIDDDKHFVGLLKYQLKDAGYEVEGISSDVILTADIADYRPDLVICDLVMPVPGMDILQHVKATPRLRQVPFIFVSAYHDHEHKIRAYLSGADDYMEKPLHFPVLRAKISGMFKRLEMIQDDIFRDPMTNLYNRRFLEHEIPRLVSFHQRHDQKMVVGILDIDHFKRVNDTHGHLIGDIILENFAQSVQEAVRASDYVVRFGGEEIVVILTNSEITGAKTTLERLLERLDKDPLYENPENDLTIHISFSAGLAEFPTHAENPKELLKQADVALYAAKSAGRRQVQLAGSSR
ncbi:MAG: GGDEF domain-containing response regulator [Candidatus Marinimicrobia bacterium]|nr:GGDEF domain-containing response regulator [Candidatus Neomarinimicrobiota bacterium]MCF7839522.1 GGDEF domain-containing response regulator [Candidatus Neomarinimicrobiota bacterium]MCF7902451.1 GGDEF domain-containing response regulator [Candidatus Neomarinimicrobiota bacterium]